MWRALLGGLFSLPSAPLDTTGSIVHEAKEPKAPPAKPHPVKQGARECERRRRQLERLR